MHTSGIGSRRLRYIIYQYQYHSKLIENRSNTGIIPVNPLSHWKRSTGTERGTRRRHKTALGRPGRTAVYTYTRVVKVTLNAPSPHDATHTSV